jgi:hypothetical protein
MDGRNKVPKELVHFGKREYREKKPIQVRIVRIKDKPIFKRGVLPSFMMKQHQLIQYAVFVEYIDMYRVYIFDSKGILLGAENIEKQSLVLERLAKSSKLIYYIP